MNLYHATSKKNEVNIKRNGIKPSLSKKISVDVRLNKKAVYGFTSYKDAEDFIIDNNEQYYSIFCFEADEVVIDTEYEDGNSFAVITKKNIKATLIEE